MKKLFLIVAVLVAFASSSFAQMEFGVKAGVNLNSLNNFEGADVKMNLGYHVGVFADQNFSDLFALEYGLLLDTKGHKLSASEELMGVKYDIEEKQNLTGITIPVNAKLSFADGKVYVLAGPNLCVMLCGKSTPTVNGVKGDSEDVEFSAGGRFQLGLNFGAGFNFTEKMGIRAEYNLGITKPYELSDAKFSTIAISLTYKF